MCLHDWRSVRCWLGLGLAKAAAHQHEEQWYKEDAEEGRRQHAAQHAHANRVLAGLMAKSIAPKAIGIPFVKSR